MPTHSECAAQTFASAKLYMRLALECASEANAEGAYFWRDNMAHPALCAALFWRDHEDTVAPSFAEIRREPPDFAAGDEAYVMTRYLVDVNDGTDVAIPSLPADGRDLIADTGRAASFEPPVAPAFAEDSLLARAFERVAKTVTPPAVTTGLLGMFGKRAKTAAPVVEKNSVQSPCVRSLLGVF